MSSPERADESNVIPLTRELDPDEWEDVRIVVPQPLPRINPGEYEGVSVSLKRYTAFKRSILMIRFDVFEGAMTDGVRLATLPWHGTWTSRPRASSKLGRLLCIAGMSPSRGRAINLSLLRGKLFRIRVDDVTHDTQQRRLTPETTYSVVVNILARL